MKFLVLNLLTLLIISEKIFFTELCYIWTTNGLINCCSNSNWPSYCQLVSQEEYCGSGCTDRPSCYDCFYTTRNTTAQKPSETYYPIEISMLYNGLRLTCSAEELSLLIYF
jgi:hypothetical protein